MKIFKIHIILFLVLVSFIISCPAHNNLTLTPQEKAWLKAHNNTIRIASGMQVAPLAYIDQTGKYVGLTVDHHRMISKKLKLRLKLVPVTNWQEGINKLKNDDIDILTMQYSKKRAEFFSFTRPYITTPYVIVSRKEANPKLATIKRLAVVEGYLFGEYIKVTYPGITIVNTTDNQEAMQMVKNKVVDACGINLPYATYLIEKHGMNQFKISEETAFLNSLAFGCRKSDPMLASIIDKVLKTMTKKEKRQIRHRWIQLKREPAKSGASARLIAILIGLIVISGILFREPLIQKIKAYRRPLSYILILLTLCALAIITFRYFTKSRIILSGEEKAWLSANTIVSPICLEAPPLGFTTESGQYDGICVEIDTLMMKRINARKKSICIPSWPKLYKKTLAGKVSYIYLQKTAPRSQYFNFTTPVFNIPYVLITRQSETKKLKLENLTGRTVVVPKGYLIEKYIRDNYPEVRIKTVPDHQKGLTDVSFGENDILAGNLAYCSWIIESMGISNLRISGDTGFINKLSIATIKENLILHGIMQKALNSISGKEMNDIYNHWVHIKNNTIFNKDTIKIIIGIVSACIIILSLVLLWNVLLRRRVRLQTMVIRQNEERLEIAMSVANDGIWDWQIATGKVTLDERSYTIAGYTPFEFPATVSAWEKKIHENDIDGVYSEIDSHFAGKLPLFNSEFRFLRKDKSYMWLRATGKTTEWDKAGNPLRFIGTHSDITARKEAEEKLKKARNDIANIINSMPSVLIGVKPDGTITQWNAEAEKLTGIDNNAAIGKSLSTVFPRISPELKRVRKALNTREVLKDTKKIRLDNGEVRYEELTVFPLIANGVEGAVIRIDDTTAKVRLEEMMIQSEKMLSVGGLAAGMAHEINNPLSGIMQTADVMSRRLSDVNMPANLKAAEEAGIQIEGIKTYMESRGILRMLDSINDSGMRVADIVTNMLSFARKSDASVSSCDLVNLMDKTLELAATDYDLKKKYDFKTITIHKDYDENLPPIPCEGAKLQQVFLNILRNGAQAMQDNPEKRNPSFIIRIKNEKVGEMLRIEIEDNGSGMTKSIQKRVFEPFFTTKPLGIGTGLGLSVSYFIITENHSGTMTVDTNPDRGANFIIHLPMQHDGIKKG